MMGTAPGFIPEILNTKIYNEIISINTEEAYNTTRYLAQQEGIFAGISSGATLAAGLQVAAEAEPGSTILVMLPDTGERYLSTVLFEDIEEGSDDEWLASQSPA